MLLTDALFSVDSVLWKSCNVEIKYTSCVEFFFLSTGIVKVEETFYWTMFMKAMKKIYGNIIMIIDIFRWERLKIFKNEKKEKKEN